MKRSFFFLDIPDDTGFTQSRSFLSLALIFPQYSSALVLFFSLFSSLFLDPARAGVYVTAAELSSLEQPHFKIEQGE